VGTRDAAQGRILVAGATGYIGRRLVAELLARIIAEQNPPVSFTRSLGQAA